MDDLQPMLDAFAVAGEDPAALLTPGTAHLVAYGHDLASLQSIPGVTVLAASSPHGIEARIDVDAGVRVPQPVHLCFGLLDLDYSVDAGEDAVAELVNRVYGTGRDSIRIRERVDLNAPPRARSSSRGWRCATTRPPRSSAPPTATPSMRAGTSTARRSCATARWRARCRRSALPTRWPR
jgi:hypothetical protein